MRFAHVLTENRCPACELPADSFCHHCRAELRLWEPRACVRCGAAAAASCFCVDLPEQVAWVDSLWDYDGPAGDVVEMTKHQRELWRLYTLRGEVKAWLAGVRARAPERCAIIPVPPSRRRFRRRGFDVPAILAGWMDPWWSFRRGAGALRRVVDIDPQAGQSQQARMARVAKAFRARRAPPAVLLVDDVLTTGATAAACATALAQAGATWIGISTVTRVAAEWAEETNARAE